MSLEQTLAANTAAIEALTAALLSGNALPAAGAPSASLQDKLAKAEAAVAPKAAAIKVTPSKAAPKAEKPVVAAGPTYDEVRALVMDTANVAGTNRRDLVISTLAQFGVKLATELKPEQYADFHAALTAAVAEGALA